MADSDQKEYGGTSEQRQRGLQGDSFRERQSQRPAETPDPESEEEWGIRRIAPAEPAAPYTPPSGEPVQR